MPQGKNHSSSINEETSKHPTKVSNKISAVQQNLKRKGDPFWKSTKSRKEELFDIGFEESCYEDKSSLSTLSQNSDIDIRNIFKKHPKNDNRFVKNNVDDLFNVEFEESKEESSQLIRSLSMSTSRNENEACNQDISINFKQPDLFRNSKVQNNPLNIDLEVSHEIPSENSKQSQVSNKLSQKSVDAFSLGEAKMNTLLENQNEYVNNTFNIEFEESTEASPLVQDIPQNVTVASHISNQDITINFKQPKLFKNPEMHSNQDFNVDLEESGVLTQNSQNSQVSSSSSQKSVDELSQSETKMNPLFVKHKKNVNNTFNIEFEESTEASPLIQDVPQNVTVASHINNQDITINFKQPDLFKNPEMHSNQDFNVDLEESGVLTQNSQNSQISSTYSQKSGDELSQSEPQKLLLFQTEKNNERSTVFVAFEESKNSSQSVLNAPQSSQSSNETFSQDAIVNNKKPELFKNLKTHSSHIFDIDLEESRNRTQDTQYSQTANTFSQKSVDAVSQSESDENPIFHNRNTNENECFEVQFEESGHLESEEHSQKTQFSQSSNNNKENIDETTVNFRKSNPFRDTNERRLNKSFDVDFEESKSVANVLNTSHGTPEKSQNQPFRKSSKAIEDNFDNFNESEHENNVDDVTEKSNSVLTVNRESLTSFTAGASRINTTRTSTNLDQSSFNDDNLGHWMSDHSEDEIEIPKKVELETDYRKTLPPDDISPPLDFEEEESHVQQFQHKLKEIVNNAKSGKLQHKTPNLPKQKITEKPKKPEIKRTVTTKLSLRKPAPFATKRMYNHIIRKIRPKYGIDSVVQAEELVILICDVVKIIIRRKKYQKKLINDLKVEMAKMGVIETTFQFYDFVREFLPYEFRLKVVPCIQPGTNIVYPPKDAKNPFEKII